MTDVETGLEAKATALKSCYGSKKVEKKSSNEASNSYSEIQKSHNLHLSTFLRTKYLLQVLTEKKSHIKCVPAETGLYCPQLEEEITRESSF